MVSDLMKKYLEKFKGYDLKNVCLMIAGFEGEPVNVKFVKRVTFPILKEYGGFWLGTAPGKSWYEKRYDLPMLRDLLMDRGMWVDVAETSVTWSNLLLLWKDVKQSINEKLHERGLPGWVGAHISHSYSNGVCIYFHFASLQTTETPEEEVKVYIEAKKAGTEAILRNQGALSHHHGVGFEHVPFMARYFDEGGLRTLRALKRFLDPNNVCNPGKLLPEEGKEDMNYEGHLFYLRGVIEHEDGDEAKSAKVPLKGKPSSLLTQKVKSQL
jgi:alkyldihydroxyacetonephosphate synthase